MFVILLSTLRSLKWVSPIRFCAEINVLIFHTGSLFPAHLVLVLVTVVNILLYLTRHVQLNASGSRDWNSQSAAYSLVTPLRHEFAETTRS